MGVAAFEPCGVFVGATVAVAFAVLVAEGVVDGPGVPVPGGPVVALPPGFVGLALAVALGEAVTEGVGETGGPPEAPHATIPRDCASFTARSFLKSGKGMQLFPWQSPPL